MLRNWLVGIGAVVLVGGIVVLSTTGFPPAFVFLFWGGFTVLAVLVERFRYKPLETAKPGPGWERTTERFVDDETGRPVTVYVRPETGERKYVED